jgi:hypothetical protein
MSSHGRRGLSEAAPRKLDVAAARAFVGNKVPRRMFFKAVQSNGKATMPYSRPISRFYLTAPRVPTFAISIVLALFALFAIYGHVAQLHGISGFVLLLIAYVVLLAGTLLRGV